MNNLSILSKPEITMTSREIAELAGKRHDHVMRDIRSMLEQLEKDAPKFGEIYIDGMGRKQTQFRLDRLHVECLLTGYSIPLRMKVLERLTELEQINTPQLPNFNNPAEAARAWADEVEAKQAAIALIEQQKPAVQFLENFVETKSTKGLREVAKVLGIKEREFISDLEERKILFRQSGQLLPFAQYQHDGYFEVKTGEANGHAFHQTRFTPKGIAWITKRLGLTDN